MGKYDEAVKILQELAKREAVEHPCLSEIRNLREEVEALRAEVAKLQDTTIHVPWAPPYEPWPTFPQTTWQYDGRTYT